nr:MAG TPA: Transcription factor S-II (TFIIS) [Siphoviridae sp. ctjRi1]
MAEEKREKCPGCGRMCIGKQAMWNTIDSAGFYIFAFNCAACGAVWMKAAAPMPQKKDFEKMLARAFCADSIKE